jgi:hypothetical protein
MQTRSAWEAFIGQVAMLLGIVINISVFIKVTTPAFPVECMAAGEEGGVMNIQDVLKGKSFPAGRWRRRGRRIRSFADTR